MKTLQAIAFSVLTFLLYENASAQNCRYTTETVDEFTKDSIRTTLPLKVCGGLFSPDIDLYFSKINQSYIVQIWIIDSQNFIPALEVNQGGKLYLKLADGAVIELQAIKNEVVSSQVIQGIVVRQVKPSYSVSKEDLLKIQVTSIEKLRIEFAQSNYDHKVKEANETNMIVNCILK
jgi:hypothetical protein